MRLREKYYKRLVSKHLQGETTPEEERIVQQWIERSSANKKFVEAEKGLLLLTQRKPVTYNLDNAWEKMQQRISQAGASKVVPVYPVYRAKIVRIASLSGIAAMLLMAVGGLMAVLAMVSAKTMLQLTSSQTVVDDALLPDGSRITLNTRSVLNYPEQFAHHIREVSIFGEAFFEVSSDAQRPFIIHASGLDIQVLGTSFNVEAYPDAGFVKVAVNTGKVLVYPSGMQPESGTLLQVGETATYSQATGKVLKGVVDDLNFLSWKTGVLTFRETRLADVFKALEKKYETKFTIDNPDILNERLTARFESETLDQVLETLELIFELKFVSGDSEVIVH
ncbi:hypothetical protein MASR1M74_14920 [Lentimicrobium sp.]